MNRIPTAPGRGRRILAWAGWLLLGLVLGASAGAAYGPELAGLLRPDGQIGRVAGEDARISEPGPSHRNQTRSSKSV